MKFGFLRTAAALALICSLVRNGNAAHFTFVPKEPDNRWAVAYSPFSQAPLERYTPLGDIALHQFTKFPTEAVFIALPADTRWAKLASEYFRLRLTSPPEFLYSPELRLLPLVEKQLTQAF